VLNNPLIYVDPSGHGYMFNMDDPGPEYSPMDLTKSQRESMDLEINVRTLPDGSAMVTTNYDYPSGNKDWIFGIGSVGGGVFIFSFEAGTYYLIDPLTMEYYQFVFISLGTGIGFGATAQLELGYFSGPVNPKSNEWFSLTISAFAAAGPGVSAQTTSASLWTDGETGVTAGYAAGGGAALSVMGTGSLLVDTGYLLPGPILSIHNQIVGKHN